MEFQEKYTLLQSLPTSSNNDMYKAKRNSDSKIFMVKKVVYSKMQQKQKHQIVQQVNIVTEINSPSIVKYCEHFVRKTQNTLYIVMEYEPIDLLQIMKKYQEDGKYFSEQKVWKILKDLVLALKDIHKNKKGVILHRNIQPKNVFINSTSIKLGNFKFVKKLDTQQQFATTILSDTYYSSPEQLQEGLFTPKTDIWALGCLLYQICTFTSPFQGNSLFQIGNKIREGRIKPLPSIYKKQLSRVIRWCLTKDPRDRPSVEDLLGIPIINLLIRQNRLQQVNKKISQKRNKTTHLSDQIKQLEKKLLLLESDNEKILKKLNNSEIAKQYKNDQNKRNDNFFDTNIKTFDQISLNRGISQKLSEKGHSLKSTSGSMSQFINYTSTCERAYSTKLRECMIKADDHTYRQLYF